MQLPLILFGHICFVASSSLESVEKYENGFRISHSVSNSCKREIYNINGSMIIWPESKGKYTISDPPCFYKNRTLIVRKCFDNRWENFQPNICLLLEQIKIGSDSFHEFQSNEKNFYCKISKFKAEWTDKLCYGSDKTIFDLDSNEREIIFKYFIDELNSTEIWIPAKRYESISNYSPVLWRIPGIKWGNNFKGQINDELSVNKCLIATFNYTDIISVAMTNCEKKHYNLCIFKKLFVESISCPDSLPYIRIDKPNECFGITDKAGKENFAYKLLLEDKKIIKYILGKIKSKQKKLFVDKFYSANEAKNVVLLKNGLMDIVTDNNLYYLDIMKIESKDVTMFLSYNSEKKKLILTVYNRDNIFINEDYDDDYKYGIKCFTNADYELIRPVKIKSKFWENDQQSKSLFELKLYGDGPGYYWCEAHTIDNFKFIETSKIIASKKNKGHPFALFIAIPCNVINCNNINSKLKDYAKYIEDVFKQVKDVTHLHRKNLKRFEIYSVRIMNIELIIPNEKIKFLCHVTIYLKDSSIDNSSEESSEEDDDDSEIKYGIEHETYVRIRLRNFLNDILSHLKYEHSSNVNSTGFCFPDINTDITNQWRTTPLGTAATTKKLCLLSNGLPIIRKCIGDFIYGASWADISDNQKCIAKTSDSLITGKLYEIEKLKKFKDEPSAVLKEVFSILSFNKILIPADLYFLSQIVLKINSEITKSQKKVHIFNSTDTILSFNNRTSPLSDFIIKLSNNSEEIVKIYDYLMNVNRTTMVLSIKLNSTNILLESFESIMDHISTAKFENLDEQLSQVQDISYVDSLINGTIVQIDPNLMIFTIDPSIANISGVAIFSNKFSDNFLNYEYRLLHSDQSELDLLEENNLEMATFVPNYLLERLGEIDVLTNETENPSLKIIIKIYRNDNLFIENRNVTNVKVFGNVISISIPGYGSNLPDLLPIFIRTNNANNTKTENSCRYWNYETWADDGLEFIAKSMNNENVIICGCSHLTPFAYLVGGSYNLSVSSDDYVIITQVHHEALDIITLLGCSLSIVGVIGIFATAITFQTWREKASTKVLLQLSAAIGLQMILFCFVNTEVLATHLIENGIYTSCIILGACLHYSVLVQFSWMFIIAYLQYKRYVQVLGSSRPTRFFIKSFVLGWIIPLIPVILIVLIDRDAYIPEEFDASKICYPTGLALYYGIMLPIAIVVLANLVIFLIIICNIIRGPDGSLRHTEKKLAISQLRLLILLFFLLGLTWIFGFLSSMRVGIVFSYLFCLTATCQGFVLFIYFVILDPVTRKLWISYLRQISNKDVK